MAPSLQELIDFLLTEIALCGDQGASLSDIQSFTTTFYAKVAQDASHRPHTVDRRFQAKVWSWLTKHPEVSVGKNREGNHLTFDDAERLSQHADPDRAEDDSPRVFVSDERTWLAITGHEPDETKVLPTEFALLSIIASSKSSGIVQTELVRLSGQDKRSVPKRTDRLQAKGYIQKRAIQFKSIRTSLCILPKFSEPEYGAGQAPTDRGAEAMDQENRVIDFNMFTGKLFGILREYGIITRDDLKKLLGFSDRWRWKVLSRALRKFERIGVLKRVKAQSQYKDTINKSYSCVMLLREPSERDLELFHLFSRNFLSAMGQKEDAEEPDEDMEEDAGRDSTLVVNEGTVDMIKKEDNVEEVGRALPTWTPDRNLHHLILNVIDAAGTTGINNYGIVRACFGGFFRRPLENALSRLAECWQLSQPPHLRHLAIVRDTVLHRTQAMYLYYTTRNYRKLVEAGDATWEAVECTSKNANSRVPPVDAVPQLDEYGFPLTRPSKELLENGNASLLECMATCKPEDYTRSSSDPVAVRLADGSYSYRIGHQKRSPTVPQGHSTPPSASRGRPKGRPKEPKQEVQEDVNMDAIEADHEIAEIVEPKRPKKSKRAEERFKGMSEREKLEAMGMDETWTEYSVLLMERPKPGVYVTSRGRRRPVGKSRGRPRTSQLVVFKSPKLASLPWFVEEAGAVEEGAEIAENAVSETPRARGAESPIATPVLNTPAMEDSGTPTTSRGAKRGFQERLSVDGETPPAVKQTGRPPKRRRQNYQEDTDMRDVPVSTPQKQPSPNGLDIDMSEHASEHPHKRKRVPSPGPEQEAVPAGHEVNRGQQKKPRHENDDLQNGNVSVGPSDDAQFTRKTPTLESLSAGKDHQVLQIGTEPDSAMVVDHEGPPNVDQEHVTSATVEPAGRTGRDSAQAPRKRGKKGRTDTGGSVALLRKKILMDIVEKAGGAYPMGTDLWYPFATAWMKTKYKEKPDMRTLRSSIKHLIDAGKLRQLTFSGRDSKGVMVTKSMVTKPELPPDDPLVKDMQQQMLTGGTRFYFLSNAEIHPDITKRSSTGMVKREQKPIPQIPVETGLTVQLQRKPNVVLARERRIQRQFLQMFENENYAAGDQPRAGRLMTIQRPGHGPSTNMTSIARPDNAIGEGILRRAGEIKRLRTSVSSMAPYAMLMNATQTFHAASGTFGTDPGHAARKVVPRRLAPASAAPYNMPMDPKQASIATTGTFGTYAGAARRGRPTHGLPESLEPSPRRQRRAVDTAESAAQADQFFKDSDTLLRWELQNEHLLNGTRTDTWYINQTVPPSFDNAPITGEIRFDMYEPRRQAPRRDPMTTRQATRRLTDRGPPQERRLEKLTEQVAPGPHKPTPKAPIRRNRTVHTLPQAFVQRMMAAIVAVRVLAGGLEAKNVDWSLVARCFPRYDVQFLQERGRSVLNRNRLQMIKMQSDFQERFIEAYANDKVPRIDYDNLEEYDWEAVVDWAQTQLDVPSTEKLPDLPATKDQFDSVFELREEQPPSLDEIYHSVNSVTLNRKRTLFAGTPFAEPIHAKHTTPTHQQRKAHLDHLETAKSWVRANIVTPEESYNPPEARKSLEHFGESLISHAVQSLVTERVVKMGNRGRITPGRNYDITEVFINTLRKRAIESTQLRRAAQFKSTVLDPAFQTKRVYEVDYTADDGDILALINLAAHRKIILTPRNPPRDKYGLTDGDYLTRLIDKQKLRFSVQVSPIKDTYMFGNPIESKISISPPSINSTNTPTGIAKVPLWLDIHGKFFKLLWDLVAGAVVGCVAIRPGISAAGVASMMRPAVGAWEVQRMLEWMERVGIMAWRGGKGCNEKRAGWVVREWWWMVVS